MIWENIANIKDQLLKKAPEEEKYETLNREDKERMKATEDLQLRIDITTKASVRDKTPSGDSETVKRDNRIS